MDKLKIVITGTSRGIGLELTRQALSAGASVLAVARATSSGLAELKEKFDGQLDILNLDVAEEGAAEAIVSHVKWEEVDILVNNAGVYPKSTSHADFASTFAVNAVAPFLITKAFLPKLMKSKAPKSVQITSLMGSIQDNTSGGSYAYRSSKSALNMLNKCLAVENAAWLTSIAMHPGWVKTDMGGEKAPLELADSAAGIWNVVSSATRSENGKFLNFAGKELPW